VGDRSEPDVFKTLLTASFDEAESPGTLRAVYIGLFRRTPAAASALLSQFNVAWLNFYPSRRKVGELVDAPWRLTSLIGLFAYVGLWYRWRARPAPGAVSAWHMTLAVLLLSRGLAEVVLLPLQWMASQGTSDAVLVAGAVVLTALVGVNLPSIALFDPKDVLKGTAG